VSVRKEWTSEKHFRALAHARDKWPFEKLEPVLVEALPEADLRSLHPWVAMALVKFSSPPDSWKEVPPIKPKEFEALLRSIAAHVRALERDLEQVYGAAFMARQAKAKEQTYRRAAAAFEEHAGQWLPPMFADFDFDRVVRGTDAAIAVLREAPVGGVKASRRPGLEDFVSLLGAVWRKATGKTPSAEKVESKVSSDPPFVRFVQAMAKLGELEAPTRHEIKTALTP
jgi:hypothetical protein